MLDYQQSFPASPKWLSFSSAVRWSSGIRMNPSPARSWSKEWQGPMACSASSLILWTRGFWISQVCAGLSWAQDSKGVSALWDTWTCCGWPFGREWGQQCFPCLLRASPSGLVGSPCSKLHLTGVAPSCCESLGEGLGGQRPQCGARRMRWGTLGAPDLPQPCFVTRSRTLSLLSLCAAGRNAQR
jgi:hypothetical protein